MTMSSTEPPMPPKSHIRRNGAILLAILIIAVIIAVIGLWAVTNRLTNYISNLTNGLLTVIAGTYEYYQFVVPSGASNIEVSGTFTASGGSGNDIKV